MEQRRPAHQSEQPQPTQSSLWNEPQAPLNGRCRCAPNPPPRKRQNQKLTIRGRIHGFNTWKNWIEVVNLTGQRLRIGSRVVEELFGRCIAVAGLLLQRRFPQPHAQLQLIVQQSRGDDLRAHLFIVRLCVGDVSAGEEGWIGAGFHTLDYAARHLMIQLARSTIDAAKISNESLTEGHTVHTTSDTTMSHTASRCCRADALSIEASASGGGQPRHHVSR